MNHPTQPQDDGKEMSMTSIKLVELIRKAQMALDEAAKEAARCDNDKATAAIAIAKAKITESIKP